MPARDLELLCGAARRAGAIAARFHGGTYRHWDKSDGSGPVTEADLAVNEALYQDLRAARPEYGWLSEEDARDPERLEKQRVFIIDPIDGTRSFVAGEKTWALSLAVVENGKAITGVVYLPMRDKLYQAARGQGAYLNDRPLEPQGRAHLAGAKILVTRATMRSDAWQSGLPHFERHHRPSLAYRLALAAEGRFDATITLRDSWDWDIAAGALICAEAGLQVTDRFGQPLRFNSAQAQSPGVIAAKDPLQRECLKLLGVGTGGESGRVESDD